MAIDAALLTAWVVGADAARTLGAAAIVLAAIGLICWQLRRASRVTARDAVARAQRELLSGMSHELRTPLNSVIGFSNVLLKSTSGRLTAQELEYLERVHANGVQLLGVVDEALARGGRARTAGSGDSSADSGSSPESRGSGGRAAPR